MVKEIIYQLKNNNNIENILCLVKMNAAKNPIIQEFEQYKDFI